MTPRQLDLLRFFLKPRPVGAAAEAGFSNDERLAAYKSGHIRWIDGSANWQLTPDGHKALKAGGAA